MSVCCIQREGGSLNSEQFSVFNTAGITETIMDNIKIVTAGTFKIVVAKINCREGISEYYQEHRDGFDHSYPVQEDIYNYQIGDSLWDDESCE